MLTKLCIFIFISLAAYLTAQQLPQSPCPQFFSYHHDGFGYYGEIKFADWPLGESEVRVHLSQNGLSNSNYHGRLYQYPNESTNIENILQMRGATFRIDFADPGNPPRVTMLSLNGRKLCVGEEFPPPNSWGELSYKLSTYRASFNTSVSYYNVSYYNYHYNTSTTSMNTNLPITPCNIDPNKPDEIQKCLTQLINKTN